LKTTPYWFAPEAKPLPALDGDVTADAVVIGGGISGLTVAQLLSARGYDVVVLDRETCGSGATGRSSGFMTPDSELQVSQLVRRFGAHDAARLWRAAAAACEHVRQTIRQHDLDCDFIEADSLYIAADRTARGMITSEHDSRIEAGLTSAHYTNERLREAIDAQGFDSAVRYRGTFAITPHRYARALRDQLRREGVKVYEHSTALSAGDDYVVTAHGNVHAGAIFFCADHELATIGNARRTAYHAQTFLAATAPQPPERFRTLFPDGDLLVWDTDLIYHYFRRTADDRLLIGGGRLRNTYGPQTDGRTGAADLRDYARKRLPLFGDVEFTHAWSGLIGVTKDFLPIAGRDDARVRHFYAGCGAGIPWSVLAAQCAVAAMDGPASFDEFFDPRRAFTDIDPVQPLLGKPVTFALSHAYAKGLLRGYAADVRRRRPLVLGAFSAAIAGALTVARRVIRSAPDRKS
jgi:gamma-glutamylputrescine oxidase